MGPRLIEATYLMTREMAMQQANGLDQKLGHRDRDQALLAPEMTSWLSVSVIKVLSEEMKNKVFMWCSHYSPTWKDDILAAKDDLVEYRYTTAMEEPIPLDHAADAPQERLSDMITASKNEVLRELREGIDKVLAQGNKPAKPSQEIPTEQSSKRRRTNTGNAEAHNLVERLRNIDEGLCLLVYWDSDIVKEFREVAVALSPNFTAFDSVRGREPYYNDRRLEIMRNDRVHSYIGLGDKDLGILNCISQTIPHHDKSRTYMDRLIKSLTSEEQYSRYRWS